MDEMLDRLGATIKSALGGVGHAAMQVAHGELTVTAKAADIVKVATFLRDDRGLPVHLHHRRHRGRLAEREKRFDVVYHLLSPRLNQRIRVKIATDEVTPVPR